MCQCRLCRCWTCRSQYEVGQCRCRNTTCQCVSACWVRNSHCSRTARRVRTTKQLSASLVTLHSCKPALSQNNCSVERETQPCCDYRCDTTPSDRLTAVFDSFLCSMQEWHVHTKVWYTRQSQIRHGWFCRIRQSRPNVERTFDILPVKITRFRQWRPSWTCLTLATVSTTTSCWIRLCRQFVRTVRCLVTGS